MTDRVWVCSHCGKRSKWSKGWCYPMCLPEWPACSQACLNATIDAWSCTSADKPHPQNVQNAFGGEHAERAR